MAFAFTKDGWTFMQDQIHKQNFGGEQWVLGNYQGQGIDQATMEKGILDLYTKDYVDQWRKVLRGSNVVRYANLGDASRKLTLLTGSSAPLLALFWWTTQNTAIDLPGVADKFRAVHAVSPPGGVQQYILPPNQNYNNGLIGLQGAVDRAAQKDPEGERTMRDSALNATTTTRQLASGFPPDPEARVDQRSTELLLQPITYLDGIGQSDISGAGQRFCLAFNGLTNKFPFNPTVQPEVSLNELADILKPGTGKLWAFYMELNGRLQCQNGQCTASGGTPPLSPAFVRYMGQMMAFSRALYGDSGADPNYKYSLKPQTSDQVESFDVTVNGDKAQLKGGAQKAYVWPGPGGRNFNLTLHLAGGSAQEPETFDGLWAVFRFFADADRTGPAGAATCSPSPCAPAAMGVP